MCGPGDRRAGHATTGSRSPAAAVLGSIAGQPSPPTRFRLAGAAAAAVTATALRPPARYGPGSSPAFALGEPTSELPLHAGAAQAALLALLARGGGARGLRGALGLGLGGASAAGLWRLYRDAQASRQVLEDAPVEGRGPEHR